VTATKKPVKAAPTALDAAVSETEGNADTTLDLLGRSFRLIPDLSLRATYNLDKAQRSESISLLVDAMADLVHKDDREDFVEFILSEPEVDGETLTIELFVDAMNTAMENIVGRPLDK